MTLVNTTRAIACCIALALLAGPAAAQEVLSGRASVRDGDSVEITGRQVRLRGIDAAEIGQSCETAEGVAWRCGAEAANALDRLIAGRIVACETDPADPADRYGRMLGACRAGGDDLNLAMVRAGHAIAYRRYLTYDDGSARPYAAGLIAAEAEARAARRGLWQGRFDLPEIWRRATQGRRARP